MAKFRLRAYFEGHNDYDIEADSLRQAGEIFDQARQEGCYLVEPSTMSNKIELVKARMTEVFNLQDEDGNEIYP
jgi:hypothetical protein